MAGYRHKKKRIEVALTGEYQGFEATLRGKSLGEYLALQGIGDEDRSDLGSQIQEMAHALISWNLEDEDTGLPVPATPEAVFGQDQDLMLRLATGWMEGLAGVSAPLESSSTDGETSLEESLPMAPLSESLAS